MENLAKIIPKLTNKYFINTVIKFYDHMILGDYFYLVFVSEKSIITILKVTQALKVVGNNNLSGCFLKDGVKILSKPISYLCNISITSEKFPEFCKVVKL